MQNEQKPPSDKALSEAELRVQLRPICVHPTQKQPRRALTVHASRLDPFHIPLRDMARVLRLALTALAYVTLAVDRFDVDGSGAVSTEEMATICAEMNLDMTDDEILEMVIEADPDESGEIDFKEVSVLNSTA